MRAESVQTPSFSSAALPVFDAGLAYASARRILEKLIAFNTVKPNPTRPAMEWVAGILREHGIHVELLPSAADPQNHVSLIATLGPRADGGLAFSGHMDVVPVDGQAWDVPPFTLTERDGELFGRGTTDMKGFVACSLATLMGWAGAQHLFTKPVQLFLSYDEETGFVSVREMMAAAGKEFPRPALAMIGEPTELQVVTAHKGTVVLTVQVETADGKTGAADITGTLVAFTRALATATMKQELYPAFEPPYTTFNAGVLKSTADDAVRLPLERAFRLVKVEITGLGCHSSTPALGISALHLGAEVMAQIKALHGDVPVHSFSGGSAPNVVADKASLAFLVDKEQEEAFTRNLEAVCAAAAKAHALPSRSPELRLSSHAAETAPENRAELKIQFRPIVASATPGIIERYERLCAELATHHGARVALVHRRIVPPLEDTPANRARDFMLGLVKDGSGPLAVPYATEASVFQKEGAIPAVVCGPGHIKMAHVANESVSPAQLRACLALQHAAVRAHLLNREGPE